MLSGIFEDILEFILKIFRFTEGGDKNEISDEERSERAKQTIANMSVYNSKNRRSYK